VYLEEKYNDKVKKLLLIAEKTGLLPLINAEIALLENSSQAIAVDLGEEPIEIKECDKRLLEFGENAKNHFVNKGFACSVMRPWNNEYEISLYKQGGFDEIQNEIIAVLSELNFTSVEPDGAGRCVYANKEENIGCVVDRERHYISLFSKFQDS